MKLEKFLNMQADEIATLVQKSGLRVVVCPINGTRRWFMLEARKRAESGDFLDAILMKYLEIFDLFFSHGVPVLLTPILGPDIVQRGPDYKDMVMKALEQITSGEKFRQYYAERDVRTRFYGEYEAYFEEHAPEILQNLQQLQHDTRNNLKHKLFWGMFAQDSVERVAQESIAFYKDNHEAPNRTEIVCRYYGEYISSADIFIGMMPPTAFDYPLLDIGETAMYFTTAPTPYLNEKMLRKILYDYLYVRPVKDEYGAISDQQWDGLAAFYGAHSEEIYGLGMKTAGDRVWLPQVDEVKEGPSMENMDED